MGWGGGGGGLFDYSVKPGPDLSRLRLSLIMLVTRSIKARFCQVGDQVRQVKARARSLTIFVFYKGWLHQLHCAAFVGDLGRVGVS